MKKIMGILIAVFFATAVYSQNPSPQNDTLVHPHRTDSLDFKDRPQNNQRDTSNYNYERANSGKDSLPLDDRKPKRDPRLPKY